MTTTRETKADILHEAKKEIAHAAMQLEHANSTAAAPVSVAGDAVSYAAMSKMTAAERYWHLASLNERGMHWQVLVVSKESGWDYERVERLFRDFIRIYEGK